MKMNYDSQNIELIPARRLKKTIAHLLYYGTRAFAAHMNTVWVYMNGNSDQKFRILALLDASAWTFEGDHCAYALITHF